MTPEQIAAVVAVGDAIRADPRPWTELEDSERLTLEACLLPAPSFTPSQRDYLSRWWMPITQPQLDQLNAAAPPNTSFAGRADANGNLHVCADLLSDALQNGRLAALLPILETLTLIYREAEDWPPPPEDPDDI